MGYSIHQFTVFLVSVLAQTIVQLFAFTGNKTTDPLTDKAKRTSKISNLKSPLSNVNAPSFLSTSSSTPFQATLQLKHLLVMQPDIGPERWCTELKDIEAAKKMPPDGDI
jgi:hypothetical protein